MDTPYSKGIYSAVPCIGIYTVVKLFKMHKKYKNIKEKYKKHTI